jgi:hypothetical protein
MPLEPDINPETLRMTTLCIRGFQSRKDMRTTDACRDDHRNSPQTGGSCLQKEAPQAARETARCQGQLSQYAADILVLEGMVTSSARAFQFCSACQRPQERSGTMRLPCVTPSCRPAAEHQLSAEKD